MCDPGLGTRVGTFAIFSTIVPSDVVRFFIEKCSLVSLTAGYNTDRLADVEIRSLIATFRDLRPGWKTKILPDCDIGAAVRGSGD